jgi:hypothetical protein
MKLAGLLLLLVCAFLSRSARGQSQPQDDPAANPGRPTVSTPATLPPVGYLQFETGFVAAQNSPEFTSRKSLGNVTKLAVTPRIEVFTSVEPIAHFTVGTNTANATADYFLGAQYVLAQGSGAKPTLSASYVRRLYDGGAPEPDFGSPTNSLLLLGSADVKGFHYDANAFLNELVQGTVRRAQFGQSLSISHPLPLFKGFTVSGEVWHFTQPFLRSNAVGNLWAISYTAQKTLVFDVGFNRGLTGTSTRWETFVGFTYLLPHRLWRKQVARKY